MRDITVGILQLRASPSKEEALKGLQYLSSRIREADLLVMPEYAMMDPTDTPLEALRSSAEDIESPGPWLRAIERLAGEHGSCVIATLFRPAPDGRVYNTALIMAPDGEILGLYDKTHLFDAYGYRESEKIAPGNELFEPIEACGARVGVAICFELRYPEIFRAQALAGAEVVVVPAAWYRGSLKEEALRVLAQARSHENTTYTIVAALAGERFTGRSVVVNPIGYVELDVGPKPDYKEYKLSPEALEEARRILPVLRLRRPELYRQVVE